MAIITTYVDTIRNKYGKIWPLFPPAALKYKLGDYGIYSKGSFSRMGNLKDLSSFKDFKIKKQTHPKTTKNYNSTEIAFHKTNTRSDKDQTKANFELEFKSDKGVWIEIIGSQIEEIKNKEALAKQLIKKYRTNNLEDWKSKYVIITQIYKVEKALYLISQKKGTKIKIALKAPAGTLSPSNPALSLLEIGGELQAQTLSENTFSESADRHTPFIGEFVKIGGFWGPKALFKGPQDSHQYFYEGIPSYDVDEDDRDWYPCVVPHQ